MSARRGATGLRGVLLVDKPAGHTSHDVVARVRRATGEKRIGHAGTLDPMATGLLVVLVGPFTRLEPYLSSASKGYEARIVFGTETDTDDAEGAVTRTADVPATVLDAEAARAALSGFLGESEQVPPAYSAIKVDGRVAHHAARSGSALELAPRTVTVHLAELRGIDADSTGGAPFWDVDFLVSKGTYVRALARDIGRAMGTAGHLSALRRTSSGPLGIAQAHTLEAVESAAADGTLPALFADPVAALKLPTLEADPRTVLAGRSLHAPAPLQGRVAVTANSTLIAIYRAQDERLVPEAVFPLTEGVDK